ncbi:hypothetical protein F4776DRAFT_625814 [Hypoxylon sp. NC0597]|nr:hypothetical protein F4776DRAFT_625814 [Hypoxylon sp. NC0597]
MVIDRVVKGARKEVNESVEHHYHHHTHYVRVPEGANPHHISLVMDRGDINVNMIDIDDLTLLTNRHAALRNEIRAFLTTIANEHPNNRQLIQRWVDDLFEHYPNCELSRALAEDIDRGLM